MKVTFHGKEKRILKTNMPSIKIKTIAKCRIYSNTSNSEIFGRMDHCQIK